MRGEPGVVNVQYNKSADIFFVNIPKKTEAALKISRKMKLKFTEDISTGRWYIDAETYNQSNEVCHV